MKKILLLVLPFLFFGAKAQITFPAPGATWHYLLPQGGWGGPYQEINHVTKYSGDSLYMGLHTKVITGATFHGQSTCANWNDTLLIYTSNDSVFVHGSQTVHPWELMYSFNTPAGQGWTLYLKNFNGTLDTITVHVDSVKNRMINGVSLKALYVTYNQPYHFSPTSSNKYVLSSVIYDRMGDSYNLMPYLFAVLADPCYNPTLLCYSDSLIGTYQVDTAKACNYQLITSIKQIANNNTLKIYPNPAKDLLNIEVEMLNENAEIKIFDVLGNEVLNTKQKQIDVSNLQNGVYFVQVKTNKSILIQKIVVQH
ncbi:MAG: T9SS type A sorting domain-containing protein [Bacteroidia bacterium]